MLIFLFIIDQYQDGHAYLIDDFCLLVFLVCLGPHHPHTERGYRELISHFFSEVNTLCIERYEGLIITQLPVYLRNGTGVV